MATKYSWIKLYTEILDDPKVEKLPDGVWRFMIKLFLIAGKIGCAELPGVEDIVMLSRKNKLFVEHNLTLLASVGILTVANDGDYVVTNFSKRQAAMTVTERVHKFRAGETKKFQQGNLNVAEEEEEEETESIYIYDAVAEKLSACKFPFNANSRVIIQGWKDDFPNQDNVIMRAIEEAHSRGKNSLPYVDKILLNWKANGVPMTREEQIAAAKANPPHHKGAGKLTNDEFNASLSQWVVATGGE